MTVRLAGPGLCAQVGVPGAIARAGSVRELLAVRVGAGQPAEIAAVADEVAGHEKTHHRRSLRAKRIFAGLGDSLTV